MRTVTLIWATTTKCKTFCMPAPGGECLLFDFFKAKNEEKLIFLLFCPCQKTITFWGPKISNFPFLRVFFYVKGRYILVNWQIFFFFIFKVLVIFWKWKLCRFFGIELLQNITDWQQCVHFRTSQKVVNHSTLLSIYPLPIIHPHS